MKKPLLVLLWLLLALILPSCQPHMTYEEMTDAHEVAVTPKEKAELEKRIETFERDAERAQLFYENKYACEASGEHAWFCTHRGAQRHERPVESIDDLVREYRRERHDCGCARRDSLRDLF